MVIDNLIFFVFFSICRFICLYLLPLPLLLSSHVSFLFPLSYPCPTSLSPSFQLAFAWATKFSSSNPAISIMNLQKLFAKIIETSTCFHPKLISLARLCSLFSSHFFLIVPSWIVILLPTFHQFSWLSTC